MYAWAVRCVHKLHRWCSPSIKTEDLRSSAILRSLAISSGMRRKTVRWPQSDTCPAPANETSIRSHGGLLVNNESVLEQTGAGVRYITLNRPEKLNAFDRPMLLHLIVAVQRAGFDPDIRVIVI